MGPLPMAALRGATICLSLFEEYLVYTCCPGETLVSTFPLRCPGLDGELYGYSAVF